MLVVKIELWPLGDEAKATEIERFYVWNTGGDTEVGEYRYGREPGKAVVERPLMHLRAAGALRLVSSVLQNWSPRFKR